MGIFNSYVKLPEGTKHLEQWHDQTPHISPPWHGSFPSRVNPYQTILPLVAAWNLHFPRKNFWHLLATLTRVPSLFQPVWTTSPDQQYGDTSKSMIPYIWIISSYIYTCYQLQFLHHIFLGEVHHTQRWSQAERAEKSALQMRPRNLEPGRIGIWFQEIPLIFQSDISFQS